MHDGFSSFCLFVSFDGGGQVIITKLPMEDPVMLSLPGNPRHWPRAPEDAPWVVFAVSPS